MSTPTRKRRGAATQRLVADALKADGWPYAEPVGAGIGGRDITGTPGVAIECKARRGLQLGAWLRQAVAQAETGEVPVLVVRLDGQGPAGIDEWPAVVPFATLRRLLRLAGYGDPPDEPGPDEDQTPARQITADAGTGAAFADFLDRPPGADWLDCSACASRVLGNELRDDVPHAPRCPYPIQEASA
ncbi:MAG: hypothetical protein ACRD0P_25510 [Stackebrandtia sp.]